MRDALYNTRTSSDQEETVAERESMEYDVVIVGAGPAGLAAAIRLKQLAAEQQHEVSVCVIEKGSEVGAHILSGAVMDPRGLDELFPNWKELNAPLNAPVSEDRFLFLTQEKSYQVPSVLLPACFQNHGNYVVSLGNVCRWLGQQAEGLGVEIFAGFPAADVLYGDAGVTGVVTGDMGIGRDGKPTDAFHRAWSCAPSTLSSPKAAAGIWASGCRSAMPCAPMRIPNSTASGSRNCGRSSPTSISRASSSTPPAGSWNVIRTVDRSSTNALLYF
jgi:flavin-dependent dehydrogenase